MGGVFSGIDAAFFTDGALPEFGIVDVILAYEHFAESQENCAKYGEKMRKNV